MFNVLHITTLSVFLLGSAFLENTTGFPKSLDKCKQYLKAEDDFRTNDISRTLEESQPLKNKRRPGEISTQKCREYSQYIYSIQPTPILLPGSPMIRIKECGHKVANPFTAGHPARRQEFPHMAAIGYQENSGKIKWSCGGSIISDQFILTAAHCLYDPASNLNATHVRIGMIDINSSDERQEFEIAELISHECYKRPSKYHDIALIKLKNPAILSSYARPACLYGDNQIPAEKAVATGWGATTLNGVSKSDILLKVTLKLIDNADCNKNYELSNRTLSHGVLDHLQICAGSDNNEIKDTCSGDSGGPLQIYHTGDDVECMYDILGITSFGSGCGSKSGIYTRVSNYIKWIEDRVWPDSQN